MKMGPDALEWLLEPENPGARYLALRDLCALPADDAELSRAREAAHRRGPIAAVLDEMQPEGYWVKPGPGYNGKYRSTVWALLLLAQLGARVEMDERVARGCAHLLDHALTANGQFSSSGAPSGTADCLQGNMIWALLELGCVDARLDAAMDWLTRSATGEGVAPMSEKNAALRYYAGKCGPGFVCGSNWNLPCGWGAVKAALALARWPAERRTPLVERATRLALDFLLSVDPATAAYPTRADLKPSSSWRKFGFPVFYITDLLQLAEALAALGLARDPRLDRLWALIRGKQDAQGRWALEYDYAGKTWIDVGPKKQPNKWVTLRALRALRTLEV